MGLFKVVLVFVVFLVVVLFVVLEVLLVKIVVLIVLFIPVVIIFLVVRILIIFTHFSTPFLPKEKRKNQGYALSAIIALFYLCDFLKNHT